MFNTGVVLVVGTDVIVGVASGVLVCSASGRISGVVCFSFCGVSFTSMTGFSSGLF